MPFVIDIGIYNSQIHVLNGVSDDEFIDYCDKHFKDIKIERIPSTAACWTIYDEIGAAVYMLDFKVKLKNDSDSINTLCHESTHATIEILKRHSIGFVYNTTDEVYCCLNGFISGEIYKGVFKK